MARIVCQVLQRANRITFIWSEGTSTFEPYHLEGFERTNLVRIAGQIHARLGQANAEELAKLGHELYRAVVRQEVGNCGSAEQVQLWLENHITANTVERLEFLSDAPAQIPWTVLTENVSLGVWGRRFNLGAGRRVNALRQNPGQPKPTQVLAADPTLVAQLTPDQHALLTPNDTCKVVSTIASLQDELRKRAPDILSLLVRFENGVLHLGVDSFSMADLQQWLDESAEGNPDPVIVLMTSGPASEQAAWQTALGAATVSFNGLVANETLLAPAQTFAVGHALARVYAEGNYSVGEILRSLRHENAAALAFNAYCPPQVRVVLEGATDGPAAENQLEATPLPALPYRPFAAYGAADRALFYGRDDDTLRGALAIDRGDTLGILVHGSPASGKTSYLQAGLLPYLEQECIGYRALRDRAPQEPPSAERDNPVLILRCTDDLAGQFADALAAFCAQPYAYTTPTGTEVKIDLPAILRQASAGKTAASTAIQPAAAATGITETPGPADDEDDEVPSGLPTHDLWIALRDDPDLLGKLLDTITRSLPFELVIAVDQGEELITQVKTQQQESRRQKAIAMLTHASRFAPRCKFIYLIRSQALGALLSLLPDGRLPGDWRTFSLPPLTQSQMTDALLWPTNREEISYCDEVPYQKYNFAIADGLAGPIVVEAVKASATQQQSPLAIIQAVGALLYEQQKVELAGVKDALGKCLDRSLERLAITGQARQALRDLIARLAQSQPDGSLTRDVIPASALKDHWNAPADAPEPIVNLAAEEQGLFEIQQLLIGGQEGTYVSLPQDSLAQLGRSFAAERDRLAYGRTKVLDVLWIMIPLVFLGAAFTFWATRNYLSSGPDMKAIQAVFQEKEKEHKEDLKTKLTRTHAIYWRPLYYGQISQADEAIRAGNAVAARQTLAEPIGVPDPRTLLVGPSFPNLRGFDWKYLWLQLNSERRLLEGHTGRVHAMAVTLDGLRAASAGADGKVRIWDLSSGKSIAVITAPKLLNAVAFSPDGKTLAAAGDDKIVRTWDIKDLKADQETKINDETKKLEGHTDAIHALAFGKDAGTLASAGADKSVILWDVAAGKARHTFKEHAAAVKALAFHKDGKTLVSAGDEAAFYVWHTETGKHQRGETTYRSIAALAFTPDGKTLCSAGSAGAPDVGAVRFWDLAKLTESRPAIRHNSGFLGISVSADSKQLATGGKDHVVRLWEWDSGKEVRHWIGHLDAVVSVAFASDALVSAALDGTVKIWNPTRAAGHEVVKTHAEPVHALALNGKNTLLAAGSQAGSIKLLDPKSGKVLFEVAPPGKHAITSLAFSNAKEKAPAYLAAGIRTDKDEGEVRIWQIEHDPKKGYSTSAHQTFKEHTKAVTCLAFHPSEEKAYMLLSGSADKTVKVWDAKAGKLLASHAAHKDEVRCVAWSFDPNVFFSAGRDKSICVYELNSKQFRTLATAHTAAIESIAIFDYEAKAKDDDEDGGEPFTGIVTGGADQTVLIYLVDKHQRGADAAKALMRQNFYRAHTQPVTSVVFNKASSSNIFTASLDGTIRICDYYQERLTLTGHQGPVRALAVAGDQSFLASAGDDGTVRIWRTLAPPAAKDEKKE